MKPLLPILLLLLPLLFFGSRCKKAPTSGPTEVSGYTLNKNTGKRVPNIPIYFGVLNSELAWGGYAKNRIAVSDANGYYSFSFNASSKRDYIVNATDDNLYQGVPNDGLKLKPGVPNKLDIPLQPYGWIRLELINVPPHDTLDFLGIAIASGNINIVQQSRDTCLKWKCPGNRNFTYALVVKDDSNYVTLLPTYVNGGDTGLYTFNF